jgi:hypothetical protein
MGRLSEFFSLSFELSGKLRARSSEGNRPKLYQRMVIAHAAPLKFSSALVTPATAKP